MNVQNALYIIKGARDSAAHPSTEDLDAEYTRVALYHIVDVLDKINALKQKRGLKNIERNFLDLNYHNCYSMSRLR